MLRRPGSTWPRIVALVSVTLAAPGVVAVSAGAGAAANASVASVPARAVAVRLIPSCTRRPPGAMRRSAIRPATASGEKRLELLRLGDGPFAGETLADVRRGPAVD